MEENLRYTVGLDVGTENVRAVVMSMNREGTMSVVGYGERVNAGMRKGVVVNLSGPSEAIDNMLGEVERMSGYEVNSATVSINGTHVRSTKVEGMIAVGADGHEIVEEDLNRVENAAIVGRMPANQKILDVVPLNYVLDGQSGIRDPIGMEGSRLELKANVISALLPNCVSLEKALEGANLRAERMIPTAMAAGRAVLNERQIENGVATVDLGATTTGVAVFEEGEVQYVSVLPFGANNITNDLAIVLEIDTEVAEDIKRRFVTGEFNESEKDIVIKQGREELSFERGLVNQIVKDRLSEIFKGVREELKKAKYERRLPEGIVLVGGGAKMRDIEVYAKEALEASVKIGVPKKLGGLTDKVEKTEFATAVGLAMMAMEGSVAKMGHGTEKVKKKKEKSEGMLKKLLKKF